MTNDDVQETRFQALANIVGRLTGQFAYYGMALGTIVIAGQGAAGVSAVVGGIGAGLFYDLIKDLAHGAKLSDEEIRQRAEDAIQKSDIANLLTKDDFARGYSSLRRKLDENIRISRDVRALLHRIDQKIPEPPITPHSEPLFMVSAGDLPPDYIPRPDIHEPIVSALLDRTQDTVAITTALKGAGGFGKTTMARAICLDDRVRSVFADGILWVTLGQRPTEAELISKLLNLCELLTRRRPALTELEPARIAFRDAVANRNILLVVDDVWRQADVRPFLLSEDRAAILMTTRQRNALPAKVRSHDVDAMRLNEAVSLLGWNIPGEQLKPQRDRFEALAKRVGEWPLLLTLANGVLRKRISDGETVGQALDYSNTALTRKGLGQAFAIDDENDRNRSAAASLAVSLDLLKDDEKSRYDRLAVFPEDTPIPLATLQTLWGLDDHDTKKLCQRFYDLSLLLRHDLSPRTIQIHDVVRTYLCEIQRSTLKSLHADFLVNYGLSEWHTLPQDEPYLWHTLAYHLHASGQTDTLRDLLLNFRYLQAKLDATDANALIADCAYVNGDEQIQLVQSALMMSAQTLAEDKRQLSSQLLGRLDAHRDSLGMLFETLVPTLRTLSPISPDCLNAVSQNLHRVLLGTDGSANSLDFSPNGKLLAVGYDNGCVRLWEVDTGRNTVTLVNHDSIVLSLAWSPDGNNIVSGDNAGFVKVWNRLSEDIICEFQHSELSGFSSYIVSLVWYDADTFRLVAADGSFSEYSIKSTTQLNYGAAIKIPSELHSQRLFTHDEQLSAALNQITIWSIAWNSDKTVFACVLRLIPLTLVAFREIASGKYTFLSVTDFVAVSQFGNVAWSSDDNHIILSETDGLCEIDLRSRKSTRMYKHQYILGSHIGLTQNGKSIILVFDSGHKVAILDRVETHGRVIGSHLNMITAISLSPDNQFIASSDQGGLVNIWNFTEKLQNDTTRLSIGRIASVRWDSTENCLAVCQQYPENTISVYQRDGNAINIYRELQFNAGEMAWSPDSRYLAVGNNKELIVWDLEQDVTTPCDYPIQGSIHSIIWHGPDTFTTISNDKCARSWDRATGKMLREQPFIDNELVSNLIVSPEGSRTERKGHVSGIFAVSDNRESVLVASPSSQQSVQIWQLDTGEEIQVVPKLPAVVRLLAWSRDAKYLAIVTAVSTPANPDEYASHIWNTESQEMETVTTNIPIHNLLWLPDGERILVSSANKVGIWDLNTNTVNFGFYADAYITALDWLDSLQAVTVGSLDGRLFHLQWIP